MVKSMISGFQVCVYLYIALCLLWEMAERVLDMIWQDIETADQSTLQNNSNSEVQSTSEVESTTEMIDAAKYNVQEAMSLASEAPVQPFASDPGSSSPQPEPMEDVRGDQDPKEGVCATFVYGKDTDVLRSRCILHFPPGSKA